MEKFFRAFHGSTARYAGQQPATARPFEKVGGLAAQQTSGDDICVCAAANSSTQAADGCGSNTSRDTIKAVSGVVLDALLAQPFHDLASNDTRTNQTFAGCRRSAQANPTSRSRPDTPAYRTTSDEVGQ